MAEITANELITSIRATMPELDPQEQCAVLLNTLGGCAKHKQVQSKGKGISIYTRVGGKNIRLQGNMSVYVSGANSIESVQAILTSASIKNVPLKETDVSSVDESLDADGVSSVLADIGV